MSCPLRRSAASVPFFTLTALAAAILLPAAGRAQFAGPIMVNSVSGQFVVTAGPQFSPFLHDPVLATNVNYIRLDPALLAVSAERFKQSVWERLGMNPAGKWSGKIFLALRPARSPEDTAAITVGPFLRSWGCRVDLPDLITQPRFGRALSAALLLEIASRNQTDPGRVPEIPAWLADGMAQLVLARDSDKILLSLPSKTVGGLTESRMDKNQRGLNVSSAALQTLQNSPALTFDQLCWPNDRQINGQDGGIYLASAQMFTSYLLNLSNGPAKLRNFLAALPTCLNWQTAFLEAFRADFKRPLEVEKGWSLAVVRFTARDPGPHWTTGYSRDRLANLLTVPVEYRSASNSLPLHLQVSLQAAVRGFSSEQRQQVLQTKLRDLEMAQFRLAPPFAGLAAGYAKALADFLGEGRKPTPTPINKHFVGQRRNATVEATVKQLDLLDAQRRNSEAGVKPGLLPGN